MAPEAVYSNSQEETKSKIIEAATRVFGDFGYHNATIAKIAEEAGVAKGTVYWYFSGKEDLFLGMIENGLAVLVAKLERILGDKTLEIKEQLRGFITAYLGFYQDQRHLGKVIAAGVQGISSEFHKRMLGWQERFSLVNVKLIQRGVAAGIIRSDMDPESMSMAFSGIISAMGSQYLFNSRHLNKESETEFVFTLFLEGVSCKG